MCRRGGDYESVGRACWGRGCGGGRWSVVGMCRRWGDEESEAIGRQLGIRDPADEVADGQPENYRPRRRKTGWARLRDGL